MKKLKRIHKEYQILNPLYTNMNGKKISFLSDSKNWKTFLSNSKAFSLNFLLIGDKRQKIKQVYISKHDFQHKDKIILLIITDGEIWHYLSAQKLSALLKEYYQRRIMLNIIALIVSNNSDLKKQTKIVWKCLQKLFIIIM